MKSSEIRKRFLDFFANREHAVIPSASLIPEGDSSTLFTTAGMQPLVPYLLGQKHPKGNRLVNVQKCLRTGDIDEVGDATHLTFFEMLGNWSLGDYWKEDAIKWSYKLLTDKKEGFGLDPKRLYVTVFEGDDPSTPESLRTGAPRDEESADIWKSVGVPEHRIYYRGAKDNWWSPGDNGPCGPDTEMFYDVTEAGLGDLSPSEFQRADDEQKVVEIWNDVFMEYEKKDGKVVGTLERKNVDTGAGFERLAAVLQGKNNVFETDLFENILTTASKMTSDETSTRIIADHMRAAVFLIADGVTPSNTDRGYILRRLIRRSMLRGQGRNLTPEQINQLAGVIVKIYGNTYKNLENRFQEIKDKLHHEAFQFRQTIQRVLRKLERQDVKIKVPKIKIDKETGKAKDFVVKAESTEEFFPTEVAFDLYQTDGLPVELIIEEVERRGKKIDMKEFNRLLRKHQEKSRTAAAGKFKGGLGDHSQESVKLHTAHHLLLAALQKVLGSDVKQRGSNITQERLRIDFSFDRKLTDEEKEEVEKQVNEWIGQGLSVVRKEMPREEAEALGAEMEFGQKYPDVVSVYFIGPSTNAQDDAVSIEFCGGPHVENVGDLGTFKITSEKASSAGVRRIKAVLE